MNSNSLSLGMFMGAVVLIGIAVFHPSLSEARFSQIIALGSSAAGAAYGLANQKTTSENKKGRDNDKLF